MSRLRSKLSHVKTRLYRKPIDEFQRMLRWGPHAYFKCDVWAREMEAAASALEVPTVEGQCAELDGKRRNGLSESRFGGPVSLWFLTGRRFWYQTAFCAWSFAKHSRRKVILNLVDDGTLEGEHEAELRRLFPEGQTLRKDLVRERIERLLPTEQFPILRQRWNDYINIRKLTDVHLDSSGVKLVLDSDMLFFRRPDSLLHWWDAAAGLLNGGNGQQSCKNQTSEGRIDSSSSVLAQDFSATSSTSLSPCLMSDCEESYGYSRSLMEELAGVPILPLLNVGICGLSSQSLDWREIEYWCRVLVEREGTSYYLEQALVAMLASRAKPEIMPKEDYITFPHNTEILKPKAVLQHYVSDSKPGYFGRSWKLALKS